MSSAILSDFFQLKLETKDPEERFLTSGVSWEAYESLLASLGNLLSVMPRLYSHEQRIIAKSK